MKGESIIASLIHIPFSIPPYINQEIVGRSFSEKKKEFLCSKSGSLKIMGLNMKNVLKNIHDYWNIQPPHRGLDRFEAKSLEWYQSISEHRYSLVPYMKKWVNFPGAKGKNVLEIGCGAGTDLAEFARFGAKVTGLDITEAAVNLTKERFKVEKLNGEILQYDGISLPLDDNSYDYIYSWGVLHHTPNIDNLLAEIYRTLKRDGQFIFMLYSSQSLLYYYSILYRAFISGEYQTKSREELLSRYSEFRIDCPYTRAFSIGEIKERLWFFGQIDAEYQYCVYDEASSRKKLAVEPMVVKKTGVADIDLFFEEYNKAVEAHEDLSRFGWHLVGRAIKAK